MQLTKVMGVVLVLVGLLIIFGIIPIPGEVAIAVDGVKPYLDIYVSDGSDYKLVATAGTVGEQVSVTVSYNRIVVCYGDAETGIKSVKAWYKMGQTPSITELKDVTTYFPYRDYTKENEIEKFLRNIGISVDITCRYTTFTSYTGYKYGMRAQAYDKADNLADVWGYVYYGKSKLENYEIYFNGQKWDGSSKVYVAPGPLKIEVKILDAVYLDSIAYILKDEQGNKIDSDVKVGISAPTVTPITWTTKVSLEKGKTYYLTIYARIAGSDYTLASLQLPLIELTQVTQIQLLKPTTIVGLAIMAIGAVLLVYPRRKT